MAIPPVINLTKENFEFEVLKSSVPVLVDFWADWCGPCKMLAPVLDAIAKEKGSSVKIVAVNVDDQEELANRYGISNLPSLCCFKNGYLAFRSEGVAPKSQILQKLATLVP